MLKTLGKNTVRLAVSPESIGTLAASQALAQAADVLRAGGTVAFPTETVYGLGANALDAQAIAGIFLAKQRPAWDPLIVHIASTTMVNQVAANISSRAQKLMDALWPGPLTLLLPKAAAVPASVTSGRELVGIRFPAHPVARALIARAGVPLAAPSANRFGHTSPTTAQHVLDDLDGRIDFVIDGGPTAYGLESTVIEASVDSVTIYRLGAVPIDRIEAIVGNVNIYQPPQNPKAPPESLPSPGVGLRHYAPNAIVVLVNLEDVAEMDRQAKWLRVLQESSADSLRIGVMLPNGWPVPAGFTGVRYEWGNWANDRELAQRLFAGLRALDDLEAQQIFCPLPTPTGLGAAMRDRLLKAACKK